MPIQPVSGEIKAQPLNDNFSYLESMVTSIDGGPSGAFNTLEDLRNAYPSGNSHIYVIGENWYYWNESDWASGGPYPGSTPSTDSVGKEALKDYSVADIKLADLSVKSRAIQPETVAFNQAEPLLQERMTLLEKQYTEAVNLVVGQAVDKATLAKVVGNTPPRNSVGEMTINGKKYHQLADDIVENDAIKSKFKIWNFKDAIGAVDKINLATTYSNSIRVRTSKVVISTDTAITSNNVLPVSQSAWKYVKQSEYDAEQANDYIASHSLGFLCINVTKATLTASGRTFDLEGVKGYLKSIADFEIYCRTASNNYEPAFYRPCLTTFLLNPGESLTYSFPAGTTHRIEAWQKAEIKSYASDVRPNAKYMTAIKSNLDFERTNDIIRLKINFDDGECPSKDCLNVLIDDVNVPFEWMQNIGDQPLSEQEYAVYPSGCLRSGYIILVADALLEPKNVVVEVFNQPVSQDFEENVSLVFDSATNLVVSTSDVSVRLNGTKGFGINDLTYNGQSIATTHLQQAILTDVSNLENVLTVSGTANIQTFGDGITYRTVVANFDTQIAGVKQKSKVTLFANGQIESERTVVFDGYQSGFKALKFKNYLYQATFSRFSDVSLGGSFNSKNFIFTNHDVQYVVNGGGDGFVSPKVTSVNTGFGTQGGYTASIDVSNIDYYIPKKGDYFSTREIYSWSANALENQEFMIMNPMTATLTKGFRKNLKSELKQRIENLIDNTNRPEIYNWRLRLGYTTVLMAYAEIENTINQDMPAILAAWAEADNTFMTPQKMWKLYTEGLGIEYQGRNQQMLPEAIHFFEKYGLTTEKARAEQMIKDFCTFYVQVEEYSGADGSVFLGYSTQRDNLNAEAAALNGFYLKKKYFGELTAEEQEACNRIEAKFLRSIRFENVLPYIEGDSLLHQFKLHYALFSSYAFAEHYPAIVPYDTTAHLEGAVLPTGKIYEMAYDWQPTRRGQPHTSLYGIYLLLRKNEATAIQEALNLMSNLERNMLPVGGIEVPLDEWISNEDSGELNTLIALMVAVKIYYAMAGDLNA